MTARNFLPASPVYDTIEIVRDRPTVHFDADEGRYLEVCCLTCHCETAVYGFAHPVRMYVAAFDCSDCGQQLTEFDAFTREAA